MGHDTLLVTWQLILHRIHDVSPLGLTHNRIGIMELIISWFPFLIKARMLRGAKCPYIPYLITASLEIRRSFYRFDIL